MNQLSKIQLDFQNLLLTQGYTDSPGWVSSAGRARPQRQLGVYTHAYRARLSEVLADDYPAIHMAIGDDDFNTLTTTYINHYPSQSFSLRDFGKHLPEFLQINRIYKDRPWLNELAGFEWTLLDAFDAADAPVMTEMFLANIAAEDWLQLRLYVHPSVHRLDFTWNTPEMWQALTSDTPSRITAIKGEPGPWLVWRDGLITRFRSLLQDEQHAFDCILAGGNFTDLCDKLAEFMAAEDVPLRAVTLLKTWLTQGLISRTQ